MININSAFMHALDKAARNGLDMVEAFVAETRTVSVYVEDSRIKNVEEKDDRGVAIRVFHDGRMGEASSSYGGFRQIANCTDRAMAAAANSIPDEVFKAFPEPASARMLELELVDEKIDKITGGPLADVARGLIEQTCQDGVTMPKALIRCAAVDTAVANTNGLETHQANTMVYMHMTSMVRDPVPGEGIETYFGNSLEDFDPEFAGMRLRHKAMSAARAESFKGKEALTMVLPPSELSEMLVTSVGSAINGENVNRRRSVWADKVGESVASQSFTLLDNPADPRGMLSSQYDDEGSPTARKIIVDDGVLRSFLYDGYNAAMADVKSTGNGLRRSSVDPQNMWRNPLAVKPNNLVVREGQTSVEDLIAGIDKGIYVEQFAWPQADELTGRFGLEVRCGHMIEDGQMTGTVKHCLLMGNMYDALRSVEGIADDATIYKNTIVPTMSFGGAELVGAD